MITEQAAFLSPMDMMIVMAVALVVFGPAKLPEVGRQLGQALRELKKLTSDLTDSIQNESASVRSAFDTTSPYTVKPGPVDGEPHQLPGSEGYSKVEQATDVLNVRTNSDELVNSETTATGQAGAALVPLKTTAQPRPGEELK